MPDLLTAFLAGIPDEASLTRMADAFNTRAGMLEGACDAESLAWAGAYRVLAIGIEAALIRRRTGVTV